MIIEASVGAVFAVAVLILVPVFVFLKNRKKQETKKKELMQKKKAINQLNEISKLQGVEIKARIGGGNFGDGN